MLLAPQELRTYFVTSVTANRIPFLQRTANAELFQQTLFDYRDQGKYELHAYVIMADHFHLIVTPAPDVSLEKAVQFIKGGFSFRLKRRMPVWMRSFNETQILDGAKFASCRHYIEENPVRKRLCENAQDYAYSSAFDVRVDPAPSHLRG